jgi:lysophospholipase L1-like esterase
LLALFIGQAGCAEETQPSDVAAAGGSGLTPWEPTAGSGVPQGGVVGQVSAGAGGAATVAPQGGAGSRTIATGGSTSGTGQRAGTGGSAGAAGLSGGVGGAPRAEAGTRAGASGGGAGSPTVDESTCNRSGNATSQTPTIVVIGDSTASVYGQDRYPRMGWAQPLQDFFAPACATVNDMAASGRSSKSFYDEGRWTPIRDALRKGDYVLIQFGHNDEKTDDATLYTEPFTTFEQYLTKYVDESRSKGASPVLLTPIERNYWQNGKIRESHGDYPAATRQLAEKSQVPLVDMTALTKSYLEKIGQSAATNDVFLANDSTHLQEKGARTIGEIALGDLWRQSHPIARLLKTKPKSY